MSEPGRNRPAHLQLLAISWNFGWPVTAGVALGYWLDEKLGSSPAAALVLGLGAMAASVWRLISLSSQDEVERRQEQQDEENGEEGGR